MKFIKYFKVILYRGELKNDTIEYKFLNYFLYRWQYYYESLKSDYLNYHRHLWKSEASSKCNIKIHHEFRLSAPQIDNSEILQDLIFTRQSKGHRVFYTHTDHYYHSMPETVEHKNIRLKHKNKIVEITDEGSTVDVVNEIDMVSISIV